MKRSRPRGAGDSCVPARAGYTLAMRRLLFLLSLAPLALSLAACGNKGPLVLPSPPDEAEIVPDDDGVAPDPAESADEAFDDVPTDGDGDPETDTPPAGTLDRSGR